MTGVSLLLLFNQEQEMSQVRKPGFNLSQHKEGKIVLGARGQGREVCLMTGRLAQMESNTGI